MVTSFGPGAGIIESQSQREARIQEAKAHFAWEDKFANLKLKVWDIIASDSRYSIDVDKHRKFADDFVATVRVNVVGKYPEEPHFRLAERGLIIFFDKKSRLAIIESKNISPKQFYSELHEFGQSYVFSDRRFKIIGIAGNGRSATGSFV